MNDARRPRVAITAGDPHGVGSEMLLKSLSKPEITEKMIPVVIGSKRHLDISQEVARTNLKISEINAPGQARGIPGILELIPGQEVDWEAFSWGRHCAQAGAAAIAHLQQAAELALSGQVEAAVYNPLNKENMQEAGLNFPSEAEFLQHLTHSSDILIFLVGKRSIITRVTTHVPLKKVPALITKERVLKVIRMTDQGLRRLAYSRPAIGVGALNPHMGEGGRCGSEELECIIPAIQAARTEGILVRDLFPSDSLHLLFNPGHPAGHIDAAIYMYHDIAGLCSKILEAFNMFTYTVGLPFPLFTPGHGTRYDVAGQGVAADDALYNALMFAGRTRT